jgi:hypothetical protein
MGDSSSSTLDKIVDAIIPRPIVDYLNTPIYRKGPLNFNYWSIVHFVIGILVGLVFPGHLRTWVIINIVFEISEFILGIGGHPLFVEEYWDIKWDIILSLSGYGIGASVRKNLKLQK